VVFQEAIVKKKFRMGIGVLLCALVLGSCATGPIHSEDKIRKLVQALDSGKASSLGINEAPFLFDGEILFLQNHLDILWENLHTAGFRLIGAEIVRNEPIREDAYLEFGNTMDVRTFFQKYLDKNASLVEIKALSGSYVFLLGKEVNGYPSIRGFKGGFLVK
jgi:hypothetical protein